MKFLITAALMILPVVAGATTITYEVQDDHRADAVFSTNGFLPDSPGYNNGIYLTSNKLSVCTAYDNSRCYALYAAPVPNSVLFNMSAYAYDSDGDSHEFIHGNFATDMKTLGTFVDQSGMYTLTITQGSGPVTVNPEPATLGLMSVALIGIGLIARRRKSSAI